MVFAHEIKMLSEKFGFDYQEALNLIKNLKGEAWVGDPDAPKINEICNGFIGANIHFNYTVTLPNGETSSGSIENNNIVGNCFENILCARLSALLPKWKAGSNSSEPPDFWNDQWPWELKVFSRKHGAGFDIGKITGYISKLSKEGGVSENILKVKYLVFEYAETECGCYVIENFWMLNIWDLCCGYGGKKPINIGGGKGINIRPATKNQWTDEKTKEKRTPSYFLDMIEQLILSSWYKVSEEEKEKNLKSIKEQRMKLNI
jgi:hypothetical protein